MIKFRTDSAKETAELGRRLGAVLRKGDTVCLTGELGAGKTAFAQGIAEALGISGYITSPTFAIVNEYEGNIPLYHFDVYRIEDPGEMFETGFEEYISNGGVTVIEWADRISEILPPDRIEVSMEKDDIENPNSRIITMRFRGRCADYEGRLAE